MHDTIKFCLRSSGDSKKDDFVDFANMYGILTTIWVDFGSMDGVLALQRLFC